jgi:hypothetical protein
MTSNHEVAGSNPAGGVLFLDKCYVKIKNKK